MKNPPCGNSQKTGLQDRGRFSVLTTKLSPVFPCVMCYDSFLIRDVPPLHNVLLCDILTVMFYSEVYSLEKSVAYR